MELTTYEWLGIVIGGIFLLSFLIAVLLGCLIQENSGPSDNTSDYSDMKRIKNVVSFKCRAGEMWRRK